MIEIKILTDFLKDNGFNVEDWLDGDECIFSRIYSQTHVNYDIFVMLAIEGNGIVHIQDKSLNAQPVFEMHMGNPEFLEKLVDKLGSSLALGIRSY